VVVKKAPRRYPDENIAMEMTPRSLFRFDWLFVLGIFIFFGLFGFALVSCGDDDDTYVPDYTGRVAGPVVVMDGTTAVHCFYTGSGLWCYVPEP
jgi:hypothetical protein